MKKMLFLSVAMFISSVMFAQNPTISNKYSDSEISAFIQKYRNSHDHNAVPTAALLQKFQQDFPNANDVEWETNHEIYEIDFDVKFRDFIAYYDKDGNLLMYKQEVQESELPAIVKTAAEAQYPKYRFEDIEKIVQGTEVFYKIEMELNEFEVTMLITSEGKFKN